VGRKTSAPSEWSVERQADGDVIVHLAGQWTIRETRPSINELLAAVRHDGAVRVVTFEAAALEAWDSSLVSWVARLLEVAGTEGIDVDRAALPAGVTRLLDLASAVPERAGARRSTKRPPFLVRVGDETLRSIGSARQVIDFIGASTIALGRLLVGKAQIRGGDFLLIMQQTGASALGIVALISMLVGLILAFVGAIQLRMFGAQIYVASLVGIAMVRVMGAVMAGIIMAGRTGAAFAAQLGTMQVNEEIDALETLGISPMEFLVLPRMVALALMMPLLCLYADLMGILGGMIVGVFMLDLGPMEYYLKTVETVKLNDFSVGLFQAAVFGVIVAVSGCLQGMKCGRSSSAVGYAATSAVVSGIVGIVVATAIITVLCNVVGV